MKKTGPKESPQNDAHTNYQKKKHTRTYNQKENQKIIRRNIDFKGVFPFAADTISAEDINLPNERNK